MKIYNQSPSYSPPLFSGRPRSSSFDINRPPATAPKKQVSSSNLRQEAQKRTQTWADGNKHLTLSFTRTLDSAQQQLLRLKNPQGRRLERRGSTSELKKPFSLSTRNIRKQKSLSDMDLRSPAQRDGLNLLNSMDEYKGSGSHKGYFFAISGRDRENLTEFTYPKNVFEGLSRETPVLDVGCGSGRLVEQLRREGVPAEGVDASDKAPDKPYFKRNTGIEDASLPRNKFSRVFSSFGPFYYAGRDIQKAGLSNLSETLVKGGTMHFSPVDIDQIEGIVYEIPGLQVSNKDRRRGYVEIKKEQDMFKVSQNPKS